MGWRKNYVPVWKSDFYNKRLVLCWKLGKIWQLLTTKYINPKCYLGNMNFEQILGFYKALRLKSGILPNVKWQKSWKKNLQRLKIAWKKVGEIIAESWKIFGKFFKKVEKKFGKNLKKFWKNYVFWCFWWFIGFPRTRDPQIRIPRKILRQNDGLEAIERWFW